MVDFILVVLLKMAIINLLCIDMDWKMFHMVGKYILVDDLVALLESTLLKN